MLSIGTKKYRNLQEQVAYNTECIKKLDDYLDGITIEDKLVVIESDSGTFTDEELVILSGPLAFISNGSRVWMKDSETLVEFVYKAIDIKATEVGSAYFNIGGSKIVVNRETGAYNTSSDTIIITYNKTQIDSIVANIMAVKADKSELSAGLALKANIAGQAFTGAISAPSIIENMDGYYYDSSTKSASFIPLYIGVVKNGNKLTLVWCGSVQPVDQTSIYLGRIIVPTNGVGDKIYGIGLTQIVASQTTTLNVVDNVTSFLDEKYYIQKEDLSNNRTYLIPRVYLANADTSKTYYIRIEMTILLSDNLAS